MEQIKHRHWLRFIPLLILLLGLGAFFYFRLYQYVSLTMLKANRAQLVSWTNQYPILIAAVFMLIYTLAVAISMPNAVFLTILGGFLFGPILGTLYVVFSATLGACIIFLAAKTALHDLLQRKAGPWLKKMSAGFQKDVISYMLFLRLAPLFPFWLVNIVPAFFGIRLRTYFLTTFFGILPGTLVYVLLGHGLGTLLDQQKPLDLSVIFKLEILAPLIGLALLSLIPIIYKKIKQHRETTHANH